MRIGRFRGDSGTLRRGQWAGAFLSVTAGAVLLVGCVAAQPGQEMGDCVVVGPVPEDLSKLADGLLVSSGYVFSCSCNQRQLAGADEARLLGEAGEARGLGGEDEDRGLGGADEDRGLGGADEDRGLGGADEDRGLGGADEDRGLGGADEDRGLGGADEDRGLGGADEDRGLGGADEDRRLGGADGALPCHAQSWCPGYVVSGEGELSLMERGQLVPLERRCVPY